MKTTRLAAAAFCAAIALAACDKTPDAAPAAKPAAEAGTQPVSLPVIQAEAKGFTVGSAMSVRTVYVFFDPQCPHCAQLWQTAKPLKSQTKFVWIPIRLLNDTSEAQGAAILAAKDPAQAMDEHETSMAAKTGGISAMGDIAAQRAIVKKNTELFNRLGFASVPSIVGAQAQSGAMVVHEGALETPALAQMLGLAVPSAQ
jgi:thiol:disulfide interchange protein DsbG